MLQGRYIQAAGLFHHPVQDVQEFPRGRNVNLSAVYHQKIGRQAVNQIC